MVVKVQAAPEHVLNPSVADRRPPLGQCMGESGRHNFPRPLTSFVGRERAISEARRYLSSTRLLTLTGAGGIGKTRLSHEVAGGVLDEFADGTWLVELGAVTYPQLVPHAVAGVLAVREKPDQTWTAALVAALQSKQMLLVLDNCEHLIEACAELADTLLRACPELRILATSREPLGIAGETTFLVPSLSLPSVAAHRAPTASDGDSEAVRLFVERAQAVVPTFQLTSRNVAAVETICRRLDGIALAIELAAARLPVLVPDQIARRLDDRFHLLSGGSRTALPRYRTLRGLIDWSHDLLDGSEQTLFRRLAVFAGGWSLEAAEAVCAGDGLSSAEILDLLSGLVAKSLVVTDQQINGVRYRFLESLRAYASEKLSEAGEEAALYERHRDWFLALAELAEPELRGADSVQWIERLEHDRANLCAAITHCIMRGQAEPGLRLIGALTRFWLVRGPYPELRSRVSALLELPAAQGESVTLLAARATALYTAGVLAVRQDDCPAADVYHTEALAIRRRLGDPRGQAIALFSVGHLARYRGDYPRARALLEEALQMFVALGDQPWQARTHQELGVAAYFEDDTVLARSHYEASLALYRGLGDELGIVGALNDLGEVALQAGELAQARELEAACLTIARRIGDKERIAMALAALAGLAAAQGQPTRAVRLVAAAKALNEAAGQRNSPAWNAMLERWLEPARAALSPAAWESAYAAGWAMPMEAAVDEALAWLDASEQTAHRPEPVTREPVTRDEPTPISPTVVNRTLAPVRPSDTRLSPREQEVAALIARGMSNRQIAQELVITEGTAASHVKHILARLVLDSRVQVAVWAIEHGLHLQRSPTSAWSAVS